MDIYIYLLLLILFLLSGLVIDRKALVLPFIVLMLFSGLRLDVGIDYGTYELLFEWGISERQITSEPFFAYYIKIIDFVGGNVQFFFLLSAIITNYFVFLFIRQFSVNYALSILLYFCNISFYLYSFNAVRQWIACSVFLYSLTLFNNKNFKGYILINIFAALTFHYSLFFIFPLVFLTKYKFIERFRIYGYLLAFAAGIFSRIILSATIYDGYEDLSFDSTVDFKIYFFLILSFTLELFRNKIDNNRESFSKVLVNINYLSILLLIMLVLQSSGALILLFKRLHNYLFAVYIVFIPFAINKLIPVQGLRKIMSYLFCLVLIIFYLVTIYNHGMFNKLIPYNYNLNILK